MRRRMTELWILITSDKRKAIALIVLAALAGIMWIHAAAQGPEPALASPAGGEQPTGDAPAGARGVRPENGGTAAPRAVVFIPPPRPLRRDLFAPDAVRYPRPSQTDPGGPIDPKSPGGSDDIPLVDAEAQRAAAVRAVRAEAARLRLRSTMVGSVPIAVIETDERGAERAVLRPGDRYAGFLLVEVSSRSVIVEKNGVRVELSISLP